MRTVDLDGGTARLREREDVKVRHRQLLESASVAAAPAIDKIPRVEGSPNEVDFERLEEASLSFDEMQTLMQLQNASILALLEDWTFPDPVPTTLDAVLDMAAERYQQLAAAVRETGAGIVTETSFGPTNPKEPGFVDTPTQESAGSDGGSKAETASNSERATGTPSAAGMSSASAG